CWLGWHAGKKARIQRRGAEAQRSRRSKDFWRFARPRVEAPGEAHEFLVCDQVRSSGEVAARLGALDRWVAAATMSATRATRPPDRGGRLTVHGVCTEWFERCGWAGFCRRLTVHGINSGGSYSVSCWTLHIGDGPLDRR